MSQLHPDLFHTEARRVSALIDAALNPEIPDLFSEADDTDRCRCGAVPTPEARLYEMMFGQKGACHVCEYYRANRREPGDWDQECAFCESGISPEAYDGWQAPRTLLVDLGDGYLYTYVVCNEECEEEALDALYGPRYGPPEPEVELTMTADELGPWATAYLQHATNVNVNSVVFGPPGSGVYILHSGPQGDRWEQIA